MTGENGLLSILGAAVTGVFGWAFQLNSRVNVQEVEIKNLKDNQEDKIDGLGQLLTVQLTSMNERLQRIERHVLNGSFRDHDSA